MCIACQHLLVLEHRCGNWFSFSVIDLHDRRGHIAKKLRVVELMPPTLYPAKNKTPIAQRELTVLLPCCDTIRQNTAHRRFALISQDALTQIHHPATLSHNTSATFRIAADSLPCLFSPHKSVQMLFRIASRQVEQVAIAQVRNILLGVKERHAFPLAHPLIYRFLIIERERLAIPCHHNFNSSSHCTFSSNNFTNAPSFVSSEKSSPR